MTNEMTNDELTIIINKAKMTQFKENPKNKKKEFSPLVKSTINAYVTNLKKMHRELKISKSLTNLDWLLDTKNIIEFINNLNSPNTRKNYYSVVISILHYDLKKYKETIDIYVKNAQSNSLDIKLEVKKDKACSGEKIINMGEYDEFLNKLSKIKKYEADYIIFLMLKYYPIRNEIVTLKYITNADYIELDKETQDNNNWIIEKTKSLVMVRNQYKTSKILGKIETIIQQPFKSILKKYIKSFKIESNNDLFHIKQSSLSHRLGDVSNDIIGVKLGTSSIFKILCCDVIKNGNTAEKIDELKKLSKIRGTSYKVVVDYYVYGNNNDDNASVMSDD